LVLSPPISNNQHDHTKPSIAYNGEKFELIWSNPRSRIVIALFRMRENGQLFFLANCHLQGGWKNEEQRYFQLRSTLGIIMKYVQENKVDNFKCFICGDLNSSPDNVAPMLLKQGKLTEDQIVKIFGEEKKDKYTFSHNIILQDSYENLEEGRRPFSFKYGVNNDAFRDRLDYIFYSSDSIELEYIRDTTTQEEKDTEKEWGLPNLNHPSDHFPIVARFTFKN